MIGIIVTVILYSFSITEGRNVNFDPSALVGQFLQTSDHVPSVIGLDETTRKPSLIENKYEDLMKKIHEIAAEKNETIAEIVKNANDVVQRLFNASENFENHVILKNAYMGPNKAKLNPQTFAFYVLELLGSFTGIFLGALGQISMAFNHTTIEVPKATN